MTIAVEELGFDFDGVIADTAEAFIRLACGEYGYCGFTLEEITHFQLESCLSIPTDLVDKIFTDIMVDSVGAGLAPIAGAVQCLERFSEKSTVTIITARPLSRPVFDWLDHFFTGPGRDNIRVVATGDHDDKVRYIHDHGLRYFIDDRAETCIQLAKEAISPYVFNQPWNRNRHNLPTVADWQEIAALVNPREKEQP
jgi:uncharacterized HAD superfamily protein